jgi:predicted anti-sigma-YlaC factor YlaD
MAMNAHPSDLEIELARTGESSSNVLRHIGRCASCQRRIEFWEDLARDQQTLDAPLHVDPETASAISEMITGHVRRIRRRRRTPRMLRWVGLIAASAAAAIFAVNTLWFGDHQAPAPVQATRIDLNGDGRVDVLDALHFSNTIGSRKLDLSFDFNGDGRVDGGDADWIAQTAVTLSKGAP